MEHGYWTEKTRGNTASVARIGGYLKTKPEEEKKLQELMEAAETHYRHTKGSFAHGLVRMVMDEVEKGNAKRIHDAVATAREHKLDIRQALEKVKRAEARDRMETHLPNATWVASIKDEDVEFAIQIIEAFKAQGIGLKHVDAYVNDHPMTKTSGPHRSPITALRELSRKMRGQNQATLRNVVEKIKYGLSPTQAWNEVAGKTSR